MPPIDNKWTVLAEENKRLREALEKIAHDPYCSDDCSLCIVSAICYQLLAREALKEPDEENKK